MTYDEISEFVAKHDYPDFARIAIYAEVKCAFTDRPVTEEDIRTITETIYQEYVSSSDGFDFIACVWKTYDKYLGRDETEEMDWDEIVSKAITEG